MYVVLNYDVMWRKSTQCMIKKDITFSSDTTAYLDKHMKKYEIHYRVKQNIYDIQHQKWGKTLTRNIHCTSINRTRNDERHEKLKL